MVKVTEQCLPVVAISASRLLEIAVAMVNDPNYETLVVDESNNFIIIRAPGCLNHNLVVIDSKVTIQYQVEEGEVMTSYPEFLDTGEGRRVYCETCGHDAPELTEDDGRIVFKEAV